MAFTLRTPGKVEEKARTGERSLAKELMKREGKGRERWERACLGIAEEREREREGVREGWWGGERTVCECRAQKVNLIINYLVYCLVQLRHYWELRKNVMYFSYLSLHSLSFKFFLAPSFSY